MNRTRFVFPLMVVLLLGGLAGLVATIAAQGTAKVPGNIWPPAKKQMEKSIALSPEEEMKTFSMPPGFRVELVASEPMIESPILMDFDADGRLWVLEMLTFLPDTSGRDSREPLNRVSVLEDTNGDGKMDKKTVFADKLSMPRALKVLDHGVLVGEPPNLWLMKDTDGDLKADTKDAGRQHLRQPERRHRAQRQQPVLGDGQRDVLVRARLGPALAERQVRAAAGAEPRPVAGLAGRRRAASTAT